MKRTKDSVRDLWDNIKSTNIWIIGGPEREGKKVKVWEKFEEIIRENFPHHGKGNIQSSPRGSKSPYRINSRRNTRYTLIKLRKTKHKERIIKATREKEQVTCNGNPIRLIADFSAETLQARREWQDIFKVLQGKNLQPRLLDLARISFKIDGEIKSFSDKQKLSKFHATKPGYNKC